MNDTTIYMWFKLYQNDIKSDLAKWDFLNHIRKRIELIPKHEKFYQEYGKKYGLILPNKNSKGGKVE